MPRRLLTPLGSLFPGTTQYEPVTITAEEALLYVQACLWGDDHLPEADPVLIVGIYKSPLVRGTDTLFQDAAEILLSGEAQDLIYEKEFEDDDMIGGRGVFQIMRLCAADNPIRVAHPREYVTEVINDLHNEEESAA
ncbi:hypothetical protein SEA_DARTHPHADER_72 [Mycobacterium phage DarthPhader]|uniref:Uncharacterized protein n=1 Tax=Mycobacterium phage DarthPhader TaxID=1912975 RepID=A0A1I9S418_9CAUD|nr:hypothetical protein KIV60_gp29 [Mycobacterium phage DarthPhader]AOZ61312.1 hypothetical protein SEA_DARTHPHADER_72 [Mycobacterium phage DarthPhader]